MDSLYADNVGCPLLLDTEVKKEYGKLLANSTSQYKQIGELQQKSLTSKKTRQPY